jgi:hypothetical protein
MYCRVDVHSTWFSLCNICVSFMCDLLRTCNFQKARVVCSGNFSAHVAPRSPLQFCGCFWRPQSYPGPLLERHPIEEWRWLSMLSRQVRFVISILLHVGRTEHHGFDVGHIHCTWTPLKHHRTYEFLGKLNVCCRIYLREFWSMIPVAH